MGRPEANLFREDQRPAGLWVGRLGVLLADLRVGLEGDRRGLVGLQAGHQAVLGVDLRVDLRVDHRGDLLVGRLEVLGEGPPVHPWGTGRRAGHLVGLSVDLLGGLPGDLAVGPQLARRQNQLGSPLRRAVPAGELREAARCAVRLLAGLAAVDLSVVGVLVRLTAEHMMWLRSSWWHWPSATGLRTWRAGAWWSSSGWRSAWA